MKTMTAPAISRIAVNGVRFVRTASLLVDSLFNAGGTASGLFKVRKHSVLFMRPNGEPFACLVANRGHSPFFVSCSMVPQEGGKSALYYSYGLTDADRAALGLSALSYSAESDEAARVWAAANNTL